MELKVGDCVHVHDERLIDGLAGLITENKGKNKYEVYIEGDPFIIDGSNLTKTEEPTKTIKKTKTRLAIEVESDFEDDLNNESTIKYLIEQDLEDKGWQVNNIYIIKHRILPKSSKLNDKEG